MKKLLRDANATTRAGGELANALGGIAVEHGGVVFLRGELGAGKSSLVRGWLTALGVKGAMPSPTYTLVEHYACPSYHVIHMDAYRLTEAVELDYLGVTERLGPKAILLVEWPDQVAAALPPPNLEISLEYCDAQGDVSGRPLTARLLCLSIGRSSGPLSALWEAALSRDMQWELDQGSP